MAWMLAVFGLGLIWQGGCILWVGGLPLAIREGNRNRPPATSDHAFGYFWLEQYRFIGLSMLVFGVTFVTIAAVYA